MLSSTTSHLVGFDGFVDDAYGDIVLYEAQRSSEAARTSPSLSNEYSGEMQHSQSEIWHIRRGQGEL